MVNTQLLEQKIADSGYKLGFIVSNIGISRQAFNKKMKGITSFRFSEIYVLRDLLKLSTEEEQAIFFADKVGS